jgi:acetyl esterase/lipase
MGAARVLRDVVFASPMGFRPLALDLYLPEADGAPVVLFAHGGGWRAGSRRVFVPHVSAADSFERIVAAGFAVASIDYRLNAEAPFPAQVDDVREALAWVHKSGEEYGFDGSRVFLWGESAGATLISLVGLEPASGVLGVVDWYGPVNLVALAAGLSSEEAAATRETGWLGASAIDDPERARAASPFFAVSAGAPPFHIEHGTEDSAVPIEQSQEFAGALAAAGATVELVTVPGANHLWGGVTDTAPIFDRAIDFARALLGEHHASDR